MSTGLLAWWGRVRGRGHRPDATADRESAGRAAFHKVLARELSRASRHHHSLSLLVVDVDRMGGAGDRDGVFRLADGAWRGREVDQAFALGPRRFGLICPHASPAGARGIIAERLRAGIVGPAPQGPRASVGVATYPGDALDPRTLLRRAEAACLAARGAGGDRVLAWSDLPAAQAGRGLEDIWRELWLGDLAALERIRAYLEAGAQRGEVGERSRLGARVGARLGMSELEAHALQGALLLYDVGRIGVLDAIWEKPGPLTPDERRIVQTHPLVGAALLKEHPPAAAVVPAVLYHHERFDGTGYPAGLRGAEIPLTARVVHAVDAYLAMTRGRPYRPALSPQAAAAELWRGAGTQFDPDVVNALAEITGS